MSVGPFPARARSTAAFIACQTAITSQPSTEIPGIP
jgi:hypothetical protein